MTHVFINGISAKSGGGRSVLTNLLKAARETDDAFRYSVAVPSLEGYEALACARIRLLPMGAMSRTVMIPYASMVHLPALARRLGADIVFNLADIPVATRLPQLLLFDWSYAAFPDSPAWQLSSPADRLVRRTKLLLFKRLLRHVDVLIAQNQVLADQLQQIYGLNNIPVVNNAVSLDNLAADQQFDFNLGDGFKLLCLSAYYSHKNIESLIPVAQKLKEHRLNIKIITTIDRDQNPAAGRFLDDVAISNLDDIILNIGNVPMKYVPSLYMQTDALLLPTLLESFSGTYVEAMFHRKPILTSDLPFARGVCGDSAFYFDPLSTDSIFGSILDAMNNPDERQAKQNIADHLLEDMPSWNDAYKLFTKLFTQTLDNHTR